MENEWGFIGVSDHPFCLSGAWWGILMDWHEIYLLENMGY